MSDNNRENATTRLGVSKMQMTSIFKLSHQCYAILGIIRTAISPNWSMSVDVSG